MKSEVLCISNLIYNALRMVLEGRGSNRETEESRNYFQWNALLI